MSFQYNRKKNLSLRRAARPGPPCNPFERLLSQQPRGRLSCGLFCWVAPPLLPRIGQLSMHVGEPLCIYVPRAKRRGVSYVIIANCNISVTTWPITSLKLRTHVGTHPAMYLNVSQLGCDCTCARARQRCPRSRERLDRSRSNLLY